MAKRILIYTNHFFPENFKINEIAQILIEEGNSVHVITGLPNYPTGKIFEGYGFFRNSSEKKGDNLSIRRLPLIPRGKGSNSLLIFNYLSYFCSTMIYTMYIILFKKKYDIIFVHHTSPVLVTIPPIFYKMMRGSKNILWDLDMWPDTLTALGIVKSQKIGKFLERLMKLIYKSYDHIFLGSKSFLYRAVQRVEDKKVTYFPNWAESIFTNKEIKSPEKDIIFPAGLKIMYAGNIGQAQDFKNVYQTMLLLRDEPVNWLIVGDGRDRDWFESEVKMAGLTSKVTFYGNQPLDLMPYFFDNADFMFLALKDEEIFHMTVPAKLQAYMASGKPVLAMLSGEGAEIIKEAQGGFAVNSGDYVELSYTIKSCLKMDLSLIKNMGINNKNFYNQYFSLHSRKKQLEELIDG